MGCGFSVEPHNSVKNLIQLHAEGFSSAEKKIADLILAEPALVVDANVSETAFHSGVSEATIIRFCKHLGYSGFYQMKLQLSHDIGRQQRAISTDSESNQLQRSLNHMGARIQGIAGQLALEDVKLCAAAISNCSMVHVIGTGQSRVLAMDVVYRLSNLGIRTIGGGDYMCEVPHLLLAPKEDILICISKSGETKRVIHAAEIARERGITVIAITGAQKSPLSKLAKITLSSGISTEDDTNSSIYLMCVLDTVFAHIQPRWKGDKHLETIVSDRRI